MRQSNVTLMQLIELEKRLKNKDSYHTSYVLNEYFPYIDLKNSFTEWLERQKDIQHFDNLSPSEKNDVVAKWFVLCVKEKVGEILQHPERMKEGKQQKNYVNYLLKLSASFNVKIDLSEFGLFIPRRDIIQLPRNTLGNDFVIGDVHGGLSVFKKVLKKIKPHDRLFIVGDLFDRGEDSIGVYKAIKEANENKYPPVVYAVQGNHERDLLNVINSIKKENKTGLDWKNIAYWLIYCLSNGGSWIFNDRSFALANFTPDEVQKLQLLALLRRAQLSIDEEELLKLFDKIQLISKQNNDHKHAAFTSAEVRLLEIFLNDINHKNLSMKLQFGIFKNHPEIFKIISIYFSKEGEPKKKDLVDEFSEIIKKVLEASPSPLISELDEIHQYVASLPYITVVGDISKNEEKSRAFCVCHADMPLSDDDLLARLNGNATLSEKEKKYVTEARTDDKQTPIVDKGRSKTSVLTFGGHSPFTFATSVREKTNFVNLDSGAYFCGSMPVVNVTKNSVEVVETGHYITPCRDRREK